LQKIAIILFLCVLTGACSVTRKAGKNTLPEFNDNASECVLEEVIKRNITSTSFFIQKIEIELITQSGKKKFLGSIKFKYPDKFLISLKSRTGIEGMRIFINRDSILINDRINKKMYFGKSLNIKRKFGIDQRVLPLIFGDMIVDNRFNAGTDKCVDNKLMFDWNLNEARVVYHIDCKRNKTEMIDLKSTSMKENIRINYSNFTGISGTLIPRIIEIEDLQNKIKIKIKMLKTEYPWNGDIRFVPGKGYEIIEIL
jgi:hypothetical protein